MAEPKETDYVAIIADLEAKRATIDAAIAGLRVLAGLPATASVTPQNGTTSGEGVSRREEGDGEIRSDAFFGMSVPAAAKAYLQMVKRPKSTSDIAEAIQKGGILTQAQNFQINVHTSLRRDSGTFIRVKKQWGLIEWYPGRAPKVTDKK